MLKIELLRQSWLEMPRKALYELGFKLYDFHEVGCCLRPGFALQSFYGCRKIVALFNRSFGWVVAHMLLVWRKKDFRCNP